MKKLFYYTSLYIFIIIGCGFSSEFPEFHNPNTLKLAFESKLNSIRNKAYIPQICEILDSESRDTTETIKRDTIIDFRWIIRQILGMQTKGRDIVPPTHELYNNKLIGTKFFIFDEDTVCWQKINQFVDNPPTDTIFFIEEFFRIGKYRSFFWRDPKLIYVCERILPNDGTTRWRITSLKEHDRCDIDLVNRWQKDTLLKYGKDMMPGTHFYSNARSHCASRVVLSPDSVRIDMIKYYNLYKLMYPDRYSDY